MFFKDETELLRLFEGLHFGNDALAKTFVRYLCDQIFNLGHMSVGAKNFVAAYPFCVAKSSAELVAPECGRSAG